MSKIDPLARASQVQIHMNVNREFHEAFLISLKKMRYETQTSFFKEKMRELIKEAGVEYSLPKVNRKYAKPHALAPVDTPQP